MMQLDGRKLKLLKSTKSYVHAYIRILGINRFDWCLDGWIARLMPVPVVIYDQISLTKLDMRVAFCF